jgi:hypothetical protein
MARHSGESFMNLKLIAAVFVLVAAPAVAQAQKPPAAQAQKGAKPTIADVQKVVQTVTADKAKSKAYCDIEKLYGQMDALDQKKDKKKVDELGKQIDALEPKVGPEYASLMSKLQQLDSNSKEGKDLMAGFEPLDKQCTN